MRETARDKQWHRHVSAAFGPRASPRTWPRLHWLTKAQTRRTNERLITPGSGNAERHDTEERRLSRVSDIEGTTTYVGPTGAGEGLSCRPSLRRWPAGQESIVVVVIRLLSVQVENNADQNSQRLAHASRMRIPQHPRTARRTAPFVPTRFWTKRAHRRIGAS